MEALPKAAQERHSRGLCLVFHLQAWCSSPHMDGPTELCWARLDTQSALLGASQARF